MIKRAYITCEFEHEFNIGQLAERDIELVKEATGRENLYIDFVEFYRLYSDFHGDVFTADKCFQITHDVEEALRTKFLEPVAKYLMSKYNTNAVSAIIQVPNCPDRVFLYSDGGVCLVVHAECTFDIILNASEEIDERVLRRVVYANYAPQCFDGELLQLFNDVEIGKLEIEYR